jgi:hypothetical protein
MADYPIIYEPSFVVLWGLALGGGLFIGGLLTFALVAFMMLVLIHHEHAHLVQLNRRGIKVNFVKFNCWGGIIGADLEYANDAIPVHLAGVINTGLYTLASIAGLAGINILGRYYLTGFNFANNPYLSFLNSAVLFTMVLFISNIIPGSIKLKNYGTIMTDGGAAYKYLELRDELWNCGKDRAITYEGSCDV